LIADRVKRVGRFMAAQIEHRPLHVDLFLPGDNSHGLLAWAHIKLARARIIPCHNLSKKRDAALPRCRFLLVANSGY
jgi:hypothetical protein